MVRGTGRQALTDVTIRGIDDETYAQFAAEAKKRSMPIGELTTEAMRALLDAAGVPVYTIGNLDMLSVSKSDLDSVEGYVVLTSIDMLEFEDDVDWPTFNQKVKMINNVEIMKIPKALSKFQVLTKAKNIELIESKK
jgi:hypothetical protein